VPSLSALGLAVLVVEKETVAVQEEDRCRQRSKRTGRPPWIRCPSWVAPRF